MYLHILDPTLVMNRSKHWLFQGLNVITEYIPAEARKYKAGQFNQMMLFQKILVASRKIYFCFFFQGTRSYQEQIGTLCTHRFWTEVEESIPSGISCILFPSRKLWENKSVLWNIAMFFFIHGTNSLTTKKIKYHSIPFCEEKHSI